MAARPFAGMASGADAVRLTPPRTVITARAVLKDCIELVLIFGDRQFDPLKNPLLALRHDDSARLLPIKLCLRMLCFRHCGATSALSS
jgi:hypothetical protein